MPFEYRAPGATLKRFYEADTFARALVGPIYGGRKTAAVHDILGRLSDGLQPVWRWAAVRAGEAELHSETIARWQEHFTRIFRISAATPKIWDAKTLTVALNTKAGLLELRFFALDNAAHRRAFDAYQATAYWLDGARELPEAVFDQAIGGAGAYPSRLQGGCQWQGVVVTSRMPIADHWIARRFGAFAAPANGYTLFHQPGGRSAQAENLVHLREKGFSYHAAARDKPNDYVRQYIDAEWGQSAIANDEARLMREDLSGRFERLVAGMRKRVEELAAAEAAKARRAA